MTEKNAHSLLWANVPHHLPYSVFHLNVDNLGAHRASRIEEVAEARGARVLWLAPYSPDFSTIEQCWSKVKAYLRGAKARTQEQLDQALAAAIKLVTKSDIRGWFKHCGYSLARE